MAPGQFVVPGVRLVKKIAEGGMGSVWEGEHLALKTSVAVKFVLSEFGDSEEAAARFEREATAAARIKSPHVVQVFNHGHTEDDVPFIVMELLEGEDLETRLKREPKLSFELVAHVVSQAAKGLDKAHSLGIIHRDIKPSNIFLTDVGGEVFIKLLDFGIAKLSMAEIGRTRVTQTGSMIGTPVFMAPEQMTQAKDVGPPADMWSLGVVAYLALTGTLPYDSETIAGLAMAIERGTFAPATSLVPDLPKGIDAWFLRALAKDPTARFESIRELSDELAKSSGVAVPASTALRPTAPTSTPPPPLTSAKPPKRDDEPPPPMPSSPGAAQAKSSVSEPPPGALAPTLGAAPVPLAMGASPHQTVMGSSREAARTEARNQGRKVMVGVGVAALGIGAAAAVVLGIGTETAPPQAPAVSQSVSASGSATVASAEAPASAAPSASASSGEPSTVPASASALSASASVSAASARPSAGSAKPVIKVPKPPVSATAPRSAATTTASATATATAKPPAPKPTTSAAPKATGPTPGAQ